MYQLETFFRSLIQFLSLQGNLCKEIINFNLIYLYVVIFKKISFY